MADNNFDTKRNNIQKLKNKLKINKLQLNYYKDQVALLQGHTDHLRACVAELMAENKLLRKIIINQSKEV